MKKLLFVMVLAFTVFSACSDDDDNPLLPEAAVDTIVGEWQFAAYILNGVEQEGQPCEYETTVIFNADGTGLTNAYSATSLDNMCELEINTLEWINNENGTYNIQDGEFPAEDKPVTFEDGNNTLLFTDDNTEEIGQEEVNVFKYTRL